MNDFQKPTEKELREKLDPTQFQVTQQCGTEPPFRNRYWDNKKPGLYVDVISGEPLFSSLDKFDSGTGWPSFSRPVPGTEITEKKDMAHGMVRTEARSRVADSHLGHVFPDGPKPTGLRYCINSASLRFIPVEDLEKEGYGKYLSLFQKESLRSKSDQGADAATQSQKSEKATLAGGCFWGMEEILRKIPGVLSTSVGYIGGKIENPTYQQVCTGTTGHAEAIEIEFDPKRISYRKLLEYFFRMHDPTTLNRQHNDKGTQYRSAIFYHSDGQKAEAEAAKAEAGSSGKFRDAIVTEITEAGKFWSAEDYHQKYLQKNPGGYNCHVLR